MEPLDFYCERVGPGLLAEPLNAVTNAGFFLAAWAAWRLARRERALDAGVWILIALVVAIGAGSTLFHVFADTRTHVLDTTPILAFQLAFIWCYCRRAMKLGPMAAALAVAAFLAAGLFARRFPEILNGSVAYSPALAVLLVLGGWHYARGHGRDLLAAAGVLLISLGCRTVDHALCEAFPAGTHFLWHLLNSCVVYVCVCAVIRSSQSAAIQDNRDA
jgi:hypothetical protein